MIRFSEAIEIGSTLIQEDETVFYREKTISDRAHGCARGCAHGSAWTAIGKQRICVTEAHSEKFFPICKLVLNLEEIKIIALSAPNATEGIVLFQTLGELVSGVHSRGMPRLELAKRIREVEDLHPEIPGYEMEVETDAVTRYYDAMQLAARRYEA